MDAGKRKQKIFYRFGRAAKASRLLKFWAIAEAFESTAEITAAESAPTAMTCRRFVESIPPIATSGNDPTRVFILPSFAIPATGAGFALVAVVKIGPNAT